MFGVMVMMPVVIVMIAMSMSMMIRFSFIEGFCAQPALRLHCSGVGINPVSDQRDGHTGAAFAAADPRPGRRP